MSQRTHRHLVFAALALVPLAACDKPLDFDLRENFGGAFSTANAAREAVGQRPRADDRGIISYPNYQVAVARNGDQVKDVAERIGMSPSELAKFNGLNTNDPLRKNEVLALPRRVAEPSPETGSVSTGPIQPPSSVDIASLAGQAIDNATPTQVETTTLAPTPTPDTPAAVGIEPVRHKVVRGETAYTISRLYDVSVRSLSDWNGLGADFAIREGQYLLIPVPDASAPKTNKRPVARAETTNPGQGSPTPTPPSASTPLPKDAPPATQVAQDKPKSPDLGATTPKATSKSKMGYPVNGSIIRAYSKGKNDGIDISASSGTPVKAAADGRVAAITSDADKVPIVVVKHDNDLLTVYANVEGITVAKGDSVSRGQTIAKIRQGASNYVHFEVRKGFDSVDPSPYLD
ncbi:MAG: peptidoglycan DD-metalloendopeptidase family protein [Thalassovita sp.]